MPDVLLSKPEITIGRSRQNDLCLDDPSVSRMHAKIRGAAEGYAIEDAGSLHGTLVNGKPVASHRLAANDIIQIGIYRLRFVESLPAEGDRATRALHQVDHLRLLLNVTQVIASSLAIDEVLEHVIDGVLQVTRAERGFLMMVNPSGRLEFRVARNFDHTALAMEGVTTSSSILERVRRTGEAVILSDTLEADVSHSIVEMGLMSVMCVPLKVGDRLLGLIYVDSHQKSKRFIDADLELFESIAGQAALAIEKSQLYAELHRYSTSLEEQVRERTAELMQAEKMAAVGRLAAGIAHEINSPLGVIASNVDMLSQAIGRLSEPSAADDPRRFRQLSEVLPEINATFESAAARLRRIIKAFQALTGLDQAELMPVDFNGLLLEALALLDREIEGRIQVVQELGTLDRVRCSPGRMGQVFMNILLNACQSIEGAGVVYIRSEQVNGSARVTIRDTGKGMTPEQLAGAFEPGFSRKQGRVSASMSLMITRRTVEEHGGTIQIESAPGKGTTVVVSIPV